MRRADILAWTAIAAIPVLFGAFVLNSSFDHGRWSVDTGYDDISYYMRGYDRAEAIREGGIVGGIHSYIDNPPHSPFSDFIATTAFLLFGFSNQAPLVLNFIVLIGAAAITYFLFPWKHRWQGLLAVVAVLLTPTMYRAVENFRPDFAFGWVLALASALLYRTLAENKPERWAITGIVVGGAFLVKTSTLPLTIAVVGISTVLGLWRGGWNSRRPLHDLSRFAPPLIKIFALTALIVAPHYLIAGGRIYRYIRGVVFDPAESAIWRTDLDLFDRVGAYLWGTWAGQIALPHLWIFLGLIVAATLIAIRSGSRVQRGRMMHWWALIAITYTVVTANGEKTAFLGLPFFIATMAGALESAAFIASGPTANLHLNRGLMAAVAISCLSCILLFRPATLLGDYHPRSDAASMRMNEAYGELIAQLNPRQALRNDWRPPRVYVASNELLDSEILDWRSLIEGAPIDSFQNTRLTNPENHFLLMSAADFVLAAPASSMRRDPQFPSESIWNEMFDYLQSSDSFKEVGQFEPAPGNIYTLFENRKANYPPIELTPGKGFSPLENDGKNFWWWTGKEAVLSLTNLADKAATVEWRAQISLADPEALLFISTSSDPDRETEYRHSEGKEFVEPSLLIELDGKETVDIRFRYAGTPVTSPLDPRELCVRIHACWLGSDNLLDPDSIDRSLGQIAEELGKTRKR